MSKETGPSALEYILITPKQEKLPDVIGLYIKKQHKHMSGACVVCVCVRECLCWGMKNRHACKVVIA